MNEYCNHCASKLGTQNSFIGLTKSGNLAHVMCAGCGLTHVNHLGECQKCQHTSSFLHNKITYFGLVFLLAIICLVLLYFIYL